MGRGNHELGVTCCLSRLAAGSPEMHGSARGEEGRKRAVVFPGDAGHGRPAVPLKARGGRTGLWPGSPPIEPLGRYWGAETESNLVDLPQYLPYSYF